MHFHYDASWFVFFPLVSSTSDLLSFLDLWVYSFHQIWNISNHYYFKYFPFPLLFPSTPNMYVRSPDIVPKLTDARFIVFQSLFFFSQCLILNSLCCCVLKITNSYFFFCNVCSHPVHFSSLEVQSFLYFLYLFLTGLSFPLPS